MSADDFDEALAVMSSHPEQAFFAGARNESLIYVAERALGGTLPRSYREFVSRYGAGSFGAFEVYGVINDDFDNSSIPNGVWLTLNERQFGGLPGDLVIVGSTGDGDYCCLKMNEEEGPIMIFRPGISIDQQNYDQLASDFGEFLLDGVMRQI